MRFTPKEEKEINDEVERRLAKIREEVTEEVRKNLITLFPKNSPEFQALERDLFQELIFLYEYREVLTPITQSPNLSPYEKMEFEPMYRHLKMAVDKGLIKITSKSKLSRQLRGIYEGKYAINDNKSYRPPQNCIHCGAPFVNEPGSAAAKYCSHRCKLSAYYERRNKAKGIKKTIEINRKCLICGKSLEGKRAGTRTCSISCRKTLSLKNKN
jgi:predicted nucleic acid-binding Zn ribbon protein